MYKTSVVSLLAISFLVAPLAYATETTGTTGGTQTPTPVVTSAKPLPYDVTCVQNAVDKRETALIAAVDTFATSIKSALTTRKDALKAAWAITVAKDRRAARNTAWDKYKVTARDAHKTLNTARKTAHATFETDLKACKIVGFNENDKLDLSSATSL